MTVRKFALSDAALDRAPGQDAEVFLGDVVDKTGGGSISVGYGHYAPDQSNSETLKFDEAMVVLEGDLSVETSAGTVTAGPGEIIYMARGETVTYRSHGAGAVIVYVTHPHWRETL